MGSTRRSFTDEYKASAVAFILDENTSIAEAPCVTVRQAEVRQIR